MTRFFFLFLTAGFLFTACSSDSANNTTATADTTASTEASDPNRDRSAEDPSQFPAKVVPTNYDRFKKDGATKEYKTLAIKIGDMVSSNMLESMDFSNGQVTLKYVDNAAGFNKINGENRRPLTEETFATYWSTADRAGKVISNIPASLLRDYEFVNSVKVVLPTGKKTLNAMVTREILSSMTEMSWEKLSANWEVMYQNTIVRSPEGRAKFMKAIVK